MWDIWSERRWGEVGQRQMQDLRRCNLPNNYDSLERCKMKSYLAEKGTRLRKQELEGILEAIWTAQHTVPGSVRVVPGGSP